ncbi:hypothetical protein ACLB2K_058103 [Fragaria x ananassa]
MDHPNPANYLLGYLQWERTILGLHLPRRHFFRRSPAASSHSPAPPPPPSPSSSASAKSPTSAPPRKPTPSRHTASPTLSSAAPPTPSPSRVASARPAPASVFLGTHPHTGQDVAMKLMDSGSLQREREFQNELFFASVLNSEHVILVLGFSSDRKRRRMLLVYEYMSKGNLQDALVWSGNRICRPG